jgi:hypothetical protein
MKNKQKRVASCHQTFIEKREWGVGAFWEWSALQTVFELCISKKDLAKPQSQVSSKYLQS